MKHSNEDLENYERAIRNNLPETILLAKLKALSWARRPSRLAGRLALHRHAFENGADAAKRAQIDAMTVINLAIEKQRSRIKDLSEMVPCEATQIALDQAVLTLTMLETTAQEYLVSVDCVPERRTYTIRRQVFQCSATYADRVMSFDVVEANWDRAIAVAKANHPAALSIHMVEEYKLIPKP